MSLRHRLGGFAVLTLFYAVILGTANYAVAAQGTSSGTIAQPATTSTPPSDASPTAMFSDRGSATCLQCHNEAPVTNILATPHAVKGDSRTPFGQHECESCHGPSDAHVAGFTKGSPVEPAVVFKGPNASPVAARNQVCLSCHQDSEHTYWVGSQHQTNNLACVSCHMIHVTKDPILVKATQPNVCFTCHAEQRTLSMQYSHHPIREGIVVCADCHNAHGSPGPKLLKEVRVNDVCYTCHAEKRGPMLWEHQPVREECTNCHNPHGSINVRLLKEKVPFLCLDCHAATNDMGGEGISAHSVGSSSFYINGDRSCLNCHSQIHGSDSPSGSTFFR